MGWLFGNRRHGTDPREEAIQAIKKDTIEKIESATKQTKQFNDKLDRNGGVTELVFLATGGDKRK